MLVFTDSRTGFAGNAAPFPREFEAATPVHRNIADRRAAA